MVHVRSSEQAATTDTFEGSAELHAEEGIEQEIRRRVEHHKKIKNISSNGQDGQPSGRQFVRDL